MVKIRAIAPLVVGVFVVGYAALNQKPQAPVTSQQSTVSSQQKPKRSPESSLALLDGRPAPGDEVVYGELLDKFKAKCYESREDLAVIVFAATRDLKGSTNVKYPHLDTLASLEMMSDSFERKPGNCQELANYLVETNKEQ